MVAVHAGFVDTDMAALADAPKDSPESVARQVFDAAEAWVVGYTTAGNGNTVIMRWNGTTWKTGASP